MKLKVDMVSQRKNVVLTILKQKQKFVWGYITVVIIVICM